MSKYPDLHVYASKKKLPKWEIAKALGVSRFRLSGLLYPDRYPVKLDDDLVTRIAALLNQTPEYVRRQYQRAA